MGALMDAIRNEPIERMVEAIVPRAFLPYKTQATFLSEIDQADPSPPGETCCFCRDSDHQAFILPPCNHQVCLKCILKTMPQYDNRCGICRAYWYGPSPPPSITTSSDYLRFVTRDRSLLFYAAVTLLAFKNIFFSTWPQMSADLPTMMSFAYLWLSRLPHDAIMWDFAWHFFFKEQGRVSYPKVLGTWTFIVIIANVVVMISQHAMLGYIQEVTGGCKSCVRY